MKRITALLLSLLLLAALAVPVLAETETPENQEETDPVQAEEPAAPEESPTEEASPEETETPSLQETLESAAIQSSAKKTETNPAKQIQFADLRATLRKYNGNVQALEAASDEAGDLSTSDLDHAVDQLKQLSGTVQKTLGQVQMASTAEGLTEDQQLVYNALSVSLGANLASLQSQAATLESQIDSLDTTVETTQNTLNDSVNQIVKGAETLYAGIVTMESALGDVERGIETLKRNTAIVEKQVELGMASQYDAETMHHQQYAANSQLESLKYQIRTSKMTLEAMRGMELSGTVTLGDLPMPSQEDLSAVSFEANLEKSMRKNVDVLNGDAKQASDDSDSNILTYRAAKDTFTYKFKLLCLAIPEKQRLVEAAEENVTYQKRTLEIAAKKYELGMLSHEEYLNAQSDLKSAQSSVTSAKLELFSAYRDYIWARDYGIV